MIHYIPFGKNCVPALVLRGAGLRKESLPFDWVIGNPEHIKRSLDIEFEDWFDKNITTFKDDEKNTKLINEKSSHGIGTIHPSYPIPINIHPHGAFFTHINLKDEDTIKTIKKRIDRFYNIINSEDEIVFVSSIAYDQLVKHGLINYFDRTAKTSFILLEWAESKSITFSIENYTEYTKILFTGLHEWDQDMFDFVSEKIKSLYD